MPIVFKKDDKFEDLGSIEEFFSGYGDSSVSIEDIDEINIRLTIVSNQEIKFEILCSTRLSSIIRQYGGFPDEMEKYRILKITKNDGSKYIRVSQSIDIDGSLPDSEILEKRLKGNVRQFFKIEDLNKVQ
jgi:hypothetical protein